MSIEIYKVDVKNIINIISTDTPTGIYKPAHTDKYFTEIYRYDRLSIYIQRKSKTNTIKEYSIRLGGNSCVIDYDKKYKLKSISNAKIINIFNHVFDKGEKYIIFDNSYDNLHHMIINENDLQYLNTNITKNIYNLSSLIKNDEEDTNE